MIVLTSTEKLQLVLSAGTADVDVNYNDRTATAYGPADSQQTAATATTNDVCTAPAASTSREINGLTATYKTTGGNVTLQKFNSSGSVTTKLWFGTLLVNENICYTHGGGLKVLDANGNIKESLSAASNWAVSGNLTVGGTGTFTGAVALNGQANFSAHKNGTDQTGAGSGGFTKVTFGTEIFDTGSFFASSTWTPRAGKVSMSWQVGCSTNVPTGTVFLATLYKNGARFKDGMSGVSSGIATADSTSTGAVTDSCNGSDTYEIYVFQNTGGNITINGQPYATYFSGAQVA